MTGWKTWAGSIGLALTGLGIIANAVASGDYSNINQGLVLIAGAVTAVGIGHKIEKMGL